MGYGLMEEWSGNGRHGGVNWGKGLVEEFCGRGKEGMVPRSYTL